MVFRSNFITSLFPILLLLFLFNSCSDDSPTAVDESDPPSVPEAAPVEIDNSMFQSNNPSGEEYDAFNEAATLTQAAEVNLVGATSMGQVFLNLNRNQEAVFEDGMWVWTFSYAGEGESVTIKSTAEEVTGGIEWNLYISGNFDGEESLHEFRYLTGFVSDDGMSGSWQYFLPDEANQTYADYQWETHSDTQFTFTTVINIPEEDGEFRVEYERDGDENFLEYSGYDFNQNSLVYWNTHSNTGYIDREGEERRCWDSSFAEVACS